MIDKSDPDYVNKKLLQDAKALEKKMNIQLTIAKRSSRSSGLGSRPSGHVKSQETLEKVEKKEKKSVKILERVTENEEEALLQEIESLQQQLIQRTNKVLSSEAGKNEMIKLRAQGF